MSDSNPYRPAPRLRRRVAFASLALFAAVALVACETGSRLIGTTAGPGAAGDATLSSLTVSSGTLTPAFDSGTVSYSLAVTATTTSLTVTAAPRVAASTVAINGAVVVAGNAAPSLALPVGTTNINIVVTASDTVTVRTYSIVVLRPSS